MEEKKYTDLDILLLEDVDFDAELIRRHLAKSNLIGHFRHVTNLKDFQSEIENRIPTIVLSDYQLQGNTGIDAINYRNSNGQTFPFIFVTSSENESIAVECLKAGASDYILKDKLFVLPSAINKAVEKYYTDQEVIKTRRELIKREKLLEAIADVSQMLLSETDINTAFQKLISIVGPASGQDRAYLFETKSQSGSDSLLFDMNFEWVAEGISPQIENPALKNFDIFQISPETYSALSEGIPINTVFSELPEQLCNFLESQNTLSFLLIPIRVNYKIRAAIGFDNCHTEYKWSPSDMDAFQTIGSLTENFIIRRQDELALRENEEKYRLLAENVSDVIWTMDGNGNYLYVSPSVLRLRGVTPDENLKESIEDTLTHESANVVRQLFTEMKPMIEQGAIPDPLTLVLEQKCKWGGTIWTEVIITAVYYVNGGFSHILGVTRDITKRKQFEDELIKQSELKQLILEISSEYINTPIELIDYKTNMALERLGRFVNADRAYIFDLNTATKICSNTFEWCQKGILPQIESLQDILLEERWVEKFSKGEIIYIYDVSSLPPGYEKDILESQQITSLLAVPISNNDSCSGFIGFDFVIKKHDYSENEFLLLRIFSEVLANLKARQKFERSLRESEELFQSLTIVSPVGVFRTNKDGQITYVNPRWCQLTGLLLHEAVGNRWFHAVHPNDMVKVTNHWDNTLTNQGSPDIEYRLLRKDGTIVWVIGNVVPEYQGDVIKGYIGTITDITGRRESESALRESEERFRNAITNAPIPIMIHSQGQILQLSNAFLEITRIDKDELKNLDQWHEIASPVKDNFNPVVTQRTLTDDSEIIQGTWRVDYNKEQPRTWEFSSSIIGSLGEGRNVITSMAMDITHKKQMEEDLFKSRQELNAIFQGAPILMFLINNQKEIIKVNQTAVNYTGKTRQDLLNKRLGYALNCQYCKKGSKCLEMPICIHCPMDMMIDSIFIKEQKKITVEEMELTLLKDGVQKRKTFFAHAEVLFNEPEERVLFTFLDITDRKKAEEELKKSETKFRDLVANAPVGIALVNSKGIIVDANNAAVRIFGYDLQEELINKLSEDFYLDKTERSIFLEQLEKDIAKGMETQMIDRFGNQIWLMETAVKHIFPNGDKGHLSILEDISQRKENEAKIRAYQENLEDLINARTHELENSNRELSKLYKAVEFSPSTVVITDKNGIIEYVNPHFCEVTGYSYEEAIGENPRIIKSGDTPASYYLQLWDTILSGKSWYGQFKNRKKNGDIFWELCSIAPIFDAHNEITHFVSVKQDITETILAEEKMRNYTRELEVFNKTMVDRELRMIEMKEEVNQLCRQLGIPEKYSTAWNL